MYVLFIGAHPDDCDFSCGGTAALLAQRGDRVKFISVTNGDAGHFAPEYVADRSKLAARRRIEGQRAVEVFGGEFETLDAHDGEVYVTPEMTERMVRAIRGWGPPGQGPDLVILNRQNDYHRDHRYSAQLVLDATYILTVPTLYPETPHLQRMPVFAYWFDRFQEGGAFRPDVAVPIDSVMDVKVEIARQHESQFFEWLPYNKWTDDPLPDDEAGRKEYVRAQMARRGERIAQECRHLLPEGCRLAEAFQISEYGRQLSREELAVLFPAQG
jgi:LmbE family N-acetylglucosaminyl deacetylase